MNRYAAQGLLAEAMNGKNIVVLTYGQSEVRHVLDEFLAFEVPGVKARRSNGNEQVTVGAGRIQVAPATRLDRFRGTSPDVVYLEPLVDHHLFADPRAIEFLHAMTRSRPNAIVRA